MRKDRIMITGANGQIGSVLTKALYEIYGVDNVLTTDIRMPQEMQGPFELLDIQDMERWGALIDQYQITQVYHLAAILSASGEQAPLKTWDLNMAGLLHALELARSKPIQKLFFPSSIAVFGSDAISDNTPQNTVLNPSTVYGISKVAGENWCHYFHQRYGLDVRSLRYPGIIGYQGLPGGGTTDYAVDIYHKAVKGENFQCFLEAQTALPMIYMPDAIKATVDLMEAPAEKIELRTSYNLSGMSFTPEQIAKEIRRHIPEFQISYQPDFRQEIAASWPSSVDDSLARAHWAWQEEYDLSRMTEDMIYQLRKKYQNEVVQ